MSSINNVLSFPDLYQVPALNKRQNSVPYAVLSNVFSQKDQPKLDSIAAPLRRITTIRSGMNTLTKKAYAEEKLKKQRLRENQEILLDIRSEKTSSKISKEVYKKIFCCVIL